MKKLSERAKMRLRHRQQLVAKQRLRKKNGSSPVLMLRPESGTWLARPASQNTRMPSTMCFDRNCAETVATLHGIRSRLSRPVRGGRASAKVSKHRAARVRQGAPYARFEDIEEITLGAAVVLAAEFERCRTRTKFPPTVVNVEAWKPRFLSTLWELGFFDIVGIPTEVQKPDLALNAVLLPMTSGDTADSLAVGQLVDDLKALLPQHAGVPEGFTHLYGALIEAVVNVTRHAYPQGVKFDVQHIRRWWMSGAVDRAAGWTTAVVYDQGITIPLSLPNWERHAHWSARCLRTLGVLPATNDIKSDGSAIAIAVEESVSSTEELHRGHGLAQMRNFVNGCREGYLRIMSRCGEVTYQPNAEPKVRSYEHSIGGTLIEWNVLV